MGRVFVLSGACHSFFNSASFGNWSGIQRAPALKASPSANGTLPHYQAVHMDITSQCLVEQHGRRLDRLDRGTCLLTSLKAWPYGEWRMPEVSTGTSTFTGFAHCWWFQLMTTWLPTNHVPLARRAGWTDAGMRRSWLMPLWLRPPFWFVHSLASFVWWTGRCCLYPQGSRDYKASNKVRESTHCKTSRSWDWNLPVACRCIACLRDYSDTWMGGILAK